MFKIAAAALGLCLIAGARADIAAGNFDPAVRPQDDFFRYVNGAWLNAAGVPSDQTQWGTREEMRQANFEQLHLLVERASAQGNDASAVEQKVGDFYASGMDETAIDDAGATPIAFEFDRIAALNTPADVVAEIGHLHTLGVEAGFEFGSAIDPEDGGRTIAEIRQGGLGLPERDHYLRKDPASVQLRAGYVVHISRMFQMLGDSQADADTGAWAVLRVETALARGALDPASLADPSATDHRLTLAAAAQLTPGLDWPAYFLAAGAPPFDDLNVAQPAYFSALASTLAHEPVADWKSYLRWRFLHAFAPYVSGNFVAEDFRFYGTELGGNPEDPAAVERVVLAVNGAIGDALSQLYVEDYFLPETRSRALDLVAGIRAALRARLSTAEWMDQPTRERALAKLAALGVKLGAPEAWTDYGALKINRGPYVLNILKANAFRVRRDLRRIGQPTDPAEWPLAADEVGACYDFRRNEIVLPAGMLQPPLFDPAADEAVNDGAIGSIIAREMLRGFGPLGRQYDGRGNLAGWWTPATTDRFNARAARIVSQFDDYAALPGLHVNGRLTEEENIAELGGVKLAYAAFAQTVAARPGGASGGFTPEQRFFISFASMLKTRYRPDALRRLVSDGPGAPAEFVCNGSLADLDAFAAAFQVPEGAPMRLPPGRQAVIW